MNAKEIQFLIAWLEENVPLEDRFPFNILRPRIAKMLEDGEIDSEESKELFELLHELTGGTLVAQNIESMANHIMFLSN